MNRLNCPKCENSFFTAARNSNLPCPHCGFVMKSHEPDRRYGNRQLTQKVADLFKGEVKVPVKTVDVSDTGLRIKMYKETTTLVDFTYYIFRSFECTI